MPPELANEFRRNPMVIGEERIFPPKAGAKGDRQKVGGSFETVLKMTERYAKLGKNHIAKTGNTAREMWRLMEEKVGNETAAGA